MTRTFCAPPEIHAHEEGGAEPPAAILIVANPRDVYIYELAMGLWHWRGIWSETERLSEQFPGSLFQSGCGCNFTAATPELAEFYLAVVPRADQRLCPGCELPFSEPPPLVKVDSIE